MKKSTQYKRLAGILTVALLAMLSGLFLPPAYGETNGIEPAANGPGLSEVGSIQVTKEISMDSPDDSIRVNESFFTAIFNGQGTRVSDVKEIVVKDSLPSTVTFEGLALEQTYYIYETDAAGEIIAIDGEDYGDILTPTDPEWTYIAYEGRMVELTADAPVGYTTITNYFFPEVQPGWYGTITAVLSTSGDGDLPCSGQTLFGALFYDEQHKIRATETMPFQKTGSGTWAAIFEKDLEDHLLVVGEAFYFAFTDQDGVPIPDFGEKQGCTFSADMNPVVVTEAGATLHLALVFPLDASPQTGNQGSLNWLYIVAVSAAMMALITLLLWKEGVHGYSKNDH